MLTLSEIAYLLLFSPLLSFLLVGASLKYIRPSVANYITTFSVLVSAFCATVIFNKTALEGQILHVIIAEWFKVDSFKASWAIYIDTLSSCMLLLVTYVSSLVHIYSVGYMSHDEHRPRFMSYLSFFTFCMICLVTSDNFLQMFFGWEGVGLASYLLIGFWFEKDSANTASMKAFIVNRVGDFGFALGIILIFCYFGSVEFSQVFANVQSLSEQSIRIVGLDFNIITLSCILLFVGAMGKSAQIGLHVWLPDAMEGPTPVSALIHAATMVTAGVFMLARCSYLFEYSTTALQLVTYVGAITCVFAASIAMVQNDIKRIIAYSTCSQLGYMFFACGVSAYSAAIFHLLTHGFFKALLFLGAGSVIHAMSGEQDIRHMGGIWRKIPFTYSMMWIGSLALAGIFPFSGYYSKDAILEAAYASSSSAGLVAYWLGIIAAFMTAFYSWRLIIVSFMGDCRASSKVQQHIHESPISMKLPLIALSLGAIFAGMFGVHKLNILDPECAFWKGSIMVLPNHNTLYNIENIDHIYSYMPLFAGIAGIATAYFGYSIFVKAPYVISSKLRGLYHVLLHKWYFDEVYNSCFVRSAQTIGKMFWRRLDIGLIDGIASGLASIAMLLSRGMSIMQSGFIYHYAIVMVFGMFGLLAWCVFLML